MSSFITLTLNWTVVCRAGMVTCLGNPAVEKSTPAVEGNGKQEIPNQASVMSLLTTRGRDVDHCTCVQHTRESNYIMHYIMDKTCGIIASSNIPQHALTGMSNTLQLLPLPCALKRSGPPAGPEKANTKTSSTTDTANTGIKYQYIC